MSTQCWIDGIVADTLPVLDRGLHYGDGLFETLAVKDGRIGLLQSHLERLQEGCARLGLPMPAAETVKTELQAAASGKTRAVLKLMLTRGEGGRGYRPPLEVKPRRILLRYPWPEYPESWARDGVRVRVCDTRLAEQPRLAGMKHLNRLEQVLARAEWSEADGYQEGLMLDAGDRVVEGTMSNVFASPREDVLLTPDMSRAGVAGVMRRHILEQAAKAGMQIRVAELSLVELMQANEIFLCNSLIGVWPVSELDGHDYAVGSVTRRAQRWADAC